MLHVCGPKFLHSWEREGIRILTVVEVVAIAVVPGYWQYRNRVCTVRTSECLEEVGFRQHDTKVQSYKTPSGNIFKRRPHIDMAKYIVLIFFFIYKCVSSFFHPAFFHHGFLVLGSYLDVVLPPQPSAALAYVRSLNLGVGE